MARTAEWFRGQRKESINGGADAGHMSCYDPQPDRRSIA
jgi:hypothetical protein